MELYQAHNQWKNRPSDERFETLQELHEACSNYRAHAAEADVNFRTLKVEATPNGLDLIGDTGTRATISHYAMGQLSARAGAPAAYLRSLPGDLAAENLNYGLQARDADSNEASLLFHDVDTGAQVQATDGTVAPKSSSLVLRAATTEKYKRIWNNDVTARLLQFQRENTQWTNPMAYEVTEPVNGGWPQHTGKLVPSGLYASDHDMFAFLVDESKALEGSPSGLNRGFFMWNSEVGDKSLGGSFFLYDRVCGNNIVWGAENVVDFRIRHVGNADFRAFSQIRIELRRYAEASGAAAESMVKAARSYELGGTMQDALDQLLRMASSVKAPELTQNRLTEALQLAETREDRYGNPRSLWAAVSGLTELSQQKTYADERVKIDRAAGKLLKTIKF